MRKGEPLEAKIEAQLRGWAAELESLKGKADKAVAEARRGHYEHIDELREEIEAKLKAWSKTLENSKAHAESAEATARTLVRDFTARLDAAIGRKRLRRRPAAGEGVAGEGGPGPGGTRRIEDGRGKGLGRAQGNVGQHDRQSSGAFLDQTDLETKSSAYARRD